MFSNIFSIEQFISSVSKQKNKKSANYPLLQSFKSAQNTCSYSYTFLLVCLSITAADAVDIYSSLLRKQPMTSGISLELLYVMTQLAIFLWVCS